MILATIAGPVGILACIDQRAAQRNESRAKLLQRAGVTEAEYSALADALTAANAATMRRLLNASHAALVVIEQSAAIPEGSAASHNGAIVSHFGDLG